MHRKHGTRNRLKQVRYFAAVAELLAGFYSHLIATPLIFCDHTVSSLLYFEKSFDDLPSTDDRRECAKDGH